MAKHSSGSRETSSTSGGEISKKTSESGKTPSPAEYNLNSESKNTESGKAAKSPESYNLNTVEKATTSSKSVESYSLTDTSKTEGGSKNTATEQTKTPKSEVTPNTTVSEQTKTPKSEVAPNTTVSEQTKQPVESVKPNEGDKLKTETAQPKEGKELQRKTEVSDGVMPENMEAGDRFKIEAIKEENERIQKHFDEFVEKRYAETGELETKKEILKNCREISSESYDNAGKFSADDPMLKNFSDHRYDRHVQQVIEKSLQSADQQTELARKDPDGFGKVFSTSVKENTLIAAAALHDTGMDGGLGRNGGDAAAEYKAAAEKNPEIGVSIRKQHSLESAKFILENRDKFEAMNADIEKAAQESGSKADLIDVDEAALLAAMHSKSAEHTPGVKASDLSNPEHLTKFSASLKELDSSYNDDFLYKTDESGKPILDEKGQRIVDQEAIKRITTEASALRHGDSFRPSSDVQITQAGEGVFIDASNVSETATDANKEVNDVLIYHTDENGKAIPDATLEEGDNPMSKKYAIGEKNIKDIDFAKVDESNTCCFDIYLRDGNCCPYTTAEIIAQRFDETASVTKDSTVAEKFCYRIHSDTPMGSSEKKKMAEIFDDYKDTYSAKLKYEFVDD